MVLLGSIGHFPEDVIRAEPPFSRRDGQPADGLLFRIVECSMEVIRNKEPELVLDDRTSQVPEELMEGGVGLGDDSQLILPLCSQVPIADKGADFSMENIPPRLCHDIDKPTRGLPQVGIKPV